MKKRSLHEYLWFLLQILCLRNLIKGTTTKLNYKHTNSISMCNSIENMHTHVGSLQRPFSNTYHNQHNVSFLFMLSFHLTKWWKIKYIYHFSESLILINYFKISSVIDEMYLFLEKN